jgi:hypothetical protein
VTPRINDRCKGGRKGGIATMPVRPWWTHDSTPARGDILGEKLQFKADSYVSCQYCIVSFALLLLLLLALVGNTGDTQTDRRSM